MLLYVVQEVGSRGLVCITESNGVGRGYKVSRSTVNTDWIIQRRVHYTVQDNNSDEQTLQKARVELALRKQ